MSLPPNDWAEETSENEPREEVNQVEWEDPEWSSLPAFLATLRRVLLTPKRFFANLPSTGGLGEPLGFALLVGTTGVLSSLLWQLIIEGDFSETPAVVLSKHLGNYMHDPKVVVGIFMLAPFIVALGQFGLSICLLWAARLTESARTTFADVFRVAAYAQAPAVFCLIPWGGAFIAAVWNLILLIIGISKKVHTSTLKAIFTLFLSTIFQGLFFLIILLLAGALGLWGLLFS
jgi:hypothetical protein